MSMQPYYEKDGIVIYHGDCREILPSIKADAVVTDPPYGLAFMGKRWDYDVPSVEIWAECLRVLKPVADYPQRHASTQVAMGALVDAIDMALASRDIPEADRTRRAGAA